MKLWLIWDVERFLIHVLLGLPLYALCLLSWPAALIMAGMFMMYEYGENRDIRDKYYPDIQGAIGGLFIGAIIHVLYLHFRPLF